MDPGSTGERSAPPHRWHEAADGAGFTFFEPVAPGRVSVWAGGLGWQGDEPSHLGVSALIDGVEVEVATTLPGVGSRRDSRLRPMVLDLLFHHVFGGDAELELPMVIEVVADDRTVPVAGEGLRFSGVRIEGTGRWAGEVDHDGVVIRAVTSAQAPAFSIEPCRDWRSIPEFRPAGR